MRDFKDKERLNMMGIILIVSMGVYLFFRFILPLILPFFWAAVLAVIINPVISWCYKKTKITKGLLTAFLLIFLGGGIGYLLYLLIIKLIAQIHGFIVNFSGYSQQLTQFLKDCCSNIERVIGFDASRVEEAILYNINNFAGNIQAEILPRFMDNSFTYIKGVVTFFGSFIVFIIAVLLLEKDYDKVLNTSRKYPVFKAIKEIIRRILTAGFTYLKAQLIIMLVIGGICVAGFMLVKNPYALLIGAGIGVLDALPFIGTGSVLVPWAIIMLAQGKVSNAAIYLTIYIICSFTREILEPKLIGKRLGVSPIVILIAIYTGIQLFGLKGVLYGPLAFLCVYEICAYYLSDSGHKEDKQVIPKGKENAV